MSAIAPIESRQDQLPVQSESVTLIEAVLRAASDPSVDVEKMERLMVMAKDIRKEQAETAFNKALARVQADVPRIPPDKHNKQTGSDFASYAQLDRYLRPLYREEGFALSFGTAECPLPEMVRVVCDVTHTEGHSKPYFIDMPADGKGAKGGDVMTRTHATGSAMQYGRRYLLKGIFNVAEGNDPEDDDGNGANGIEEVIDPSWFDGVASAVDQFGLKALKAEMVSVFGGVTRIPKRLVSAYNDRWAAVSQQKS